MKKMVLEYDRDATIDEILDSVRFYAIYNVKCFIRINEILIDSDDLDFEDKVKSALKGITLEEYKEYKEELRKLDYKKKVSQAYTNIRLDKALTFYMNMALKNISKNDSGKFKRELIDASMLGTDVENRYLFKYVARFLFTLNMDDIHDIYEKLLDIVDGYSDDLNSQKVNLVFSKAILLASKYSKNGHILEESFNTKKYEKKSIEIDKEIDKANKKLK